MDYRYYQGDPLIKLPQWMRKFVPWFRPVGVIMVILSLVIPMLMITRTIKLTWFIGCLPMFLNFYGAILWIYGFSLTKLKKPDDEELSQNILDYYHQKRNKEQ